MFTPSRCDVIECVICLYVFLPARFFSKFFLLNVQRAISGGCFAGRL